MAISFTNYVDITSGVSGTAAVKQRELITRVFTTNLLVPANSYAEFTSAEDVGAYFGTTSVEYERASYYFNFLSKNNVSPPKISFASWVETNRPPMIYGDPVYTATLATFQAITTGKLDIQLGASTLALTALNFSADESLASVAATVQAAIVAAGGSDPVCTGATVVFNPTSPLGAIFELTGGGTAGAGTVAVTAPTTGTDVGAALGWESPAAVISQGSVAQSLTNTMIASNGASNNFGTFCYVPTLTNTQILELQTWLSTLNVTYIGLYQVTESTASEVSAAIIATPGGAMTLAPYTTDFPEMIPGMILAATDYMGPNASQNYMYQQAPNTQASVTTDAEQEAYDALRVNYYGQTQEAEQFIAFYQRGVLTGSSNSPADMNVFANEIWFKSYVATLFLSALLTLNEIPANISGKGTMTSIIQTAVNQALANGVISVVGTANPLTPTQIQAIGQLTNSANAWQQVQTIGYWFMVYFTSSVTSDGRTEYQGNYTLVYTKNNAIRKVIGTHNLI